MIVDGAHTFAHFAFFHRDLGCIYSTAEQVDRSSEAMGREIAPDLPKGDSGPG